MAVRERVRTRAERESALLIRALPHQSPSSALGCGNRFLGDWYGTSAGKDRRRVEPDIPP